MRAHRILIAGLAVLSLGFGPAAAADDDDDDEGSPPSQTIFLDSYEAANDGAAGPVATTVPLRADAPYFVVVNGTFGNSPAAKPLTCGTPEAAPTYASPAAPQNNGPVGLDAETVFAEALVGSSCQSVRPVPRHNNRFQIDLGAGFAHVEPAGGPYAAPRADHTYTYPIRATASSAAFSFQFRDSPTSDNHGQLRIQVRAATEADCKRGGWQQFGGYRNQGQCISALAHGDDDD